LAALLKLRVQAQTCSFDSGGSDAIDDRAVLMRYALDISAARRSRECALREP
jgi:hypothetical protein